MAQSPSSRPGAGCCFTLTRSLAIVGIVVTAIFLLLACFLLLEMLAEASWMNRQQQHDAGPGASDHDKRGSRFHDHERWPHSDHQMKQQLRRLKALSAILTVGIVTGFTAVTLGSVAVASLTPPYLWSYLMMQVCNTMIWTAALAFSDADYKAIILLVVGVVNIITILALIMQARKQRQHYQRIP